MGCAGFRNQDRQLSSSELQARSLPILLCALVLGTFLASAVHAQVAEGYIQLPDSFGPLLPP
ncbi:MAG TPA: hypothetical protein VMH22_03405, partial [bacterium]|nr:hypothetical protein [bacterium]